MAGRLAIVILALVIILHSPIPVLAPVIVPEVVQEKPEPESEPVVFESTAYTWTGNRTTSGTWPSRGTVAVDPKVIPLGTRLHIEGYGEGIAEDAGRAIKGEIIDLYMEDRNEALSWGRGQVEVRIIKEE